MAQNGESAETSGIEAEAQILLTDNLELSLGFGHVTAELSADLFQPQTGALLSEEGHRLPGTAENTATASLQHSLELSGGLNLTSRISGYYQSDSINSVTDTTIQDEFPGFSLWNASDNAGKRQLVGLTVHQEHWR